MTALELNSLKEMYIRSFMQETDSNFIYDIVNYFLAKVKEREAAADSDFYNDKEALQTFMQSVEQADNGLAREVSLDDVKQMLNI